MGPNAVIIASEKSKSGGVMVRAALDEVETETLSKRARRSCRPAIRLR
jgi:hypothetical protein